MCVINRRGKQPVSYVKHHQLVQRLTLLPSTSLTGKLKYNSAQQENPTQLTQTEKNPIDGA